jgi:hypothetical protein
VHVCVTVDEEANTLVVTSINRKRQRSPSAVSLRLNVSTLVEQQLQQGLIPQMRCPTQSVSAMFVFGGLQLQHVACPCSLPFSFPLFRQRLFVHAAVLIVRIIVGSFHAPLSPAFLPPNRSLWRWQSQQLLAAAHIPLFSSKNQCSGTITFPRPILPQPRVHRHFTNVCV